MIQQSIPQGISSMEAAADPNMPSLNPIQMLHRPIPTLFSDTKELVYNIQAKLSHTNVANPEKIKL